MRDTRLVFVEGVLGAGKSTTVTKIIETLTANGAAAERVSEGDERLRVTSQLEHGYTPWLDVSVHQYVARCRANWRAFVSSRTAGDTITVCDGLLFHGNLTDLVLMDADAATVASYYEGVLAEVAALRPVLIYLRVQDATRTVREACMERGQAWETRQVSWKVLSPYGRAFAEHRNPSSGLYDHGISSNGTNPSHSCSEVQPGIGSVPSPDRRIGYRPVHW